MLSIDHAGPSITKGTAVRLLSPLSDCWQGNFRSASAAYYFSPRLAFYACHFDEDRHALEFYTEFDDLRVEEVRLLAAFALAVGMADGLRLIYPDPASIALPRLLDLTSARGLAEARRAAKAYLMGTPRRAMSDPPLPFFAGGPPYGGISKLHVDLQRRIFESIDLNDKVLLRGLATWIKAGMLWMHRSFAEEANYALYISLDASFAIVCDRLRSAGKRNPSAYDAQEYIHDAFGEDHSGLKYFEEFYDDRIRTMHPDSRLGVFVYAPLGRDDYYWLFRGLREVWRFLILGEIVEPPSVLLGD